MRLIFIRNYSNLLKILLLALLFQSCKKSDQGFLEEKEFTSMERKFFFTSRTGDLTESKLVDFFMRQNRSKRFVEQTIKIIGFPKWEKMITIKSKSGISGRGASDSLLTTYLIPFVRDSQNYVNASIIISVYPSDTTFAYRSDWEYRYKTHGSPTVDSTAEAHAVFFMFLDKITFGYSEFYVTDTSLFPEAHAANLVAKKLTILNTSSQSGRGNTAGNGQDCLLWGNYVICPTPTSPTCSGPSGCDYLNCPAGVCWLYYGCVLWELSSTQIGGSGPIIGSGGGTSVGNGGATGGSSPSPCPGTTTYQRGQTATYGCGPGWNGIITPTDPCLSAQPAINIVSALTQSNSFLQAISNIHGADPNLEHSVTFGKDANGNIAASPMSTGGPNNGTVNTNWPRAYADVHNHPSNKEPSEGDLYGIIGLSVSNVGWNTRMVSNKNDEMYALAVLDTAAAKIFRNNSFIINPTYGPILKDEIMTEYQNVSLYFQQQQYSKLYSDERALAYILDKCNTGVVLLKREGTTFKRLRTSAGSQNDTYLSNDCN